MASLFLEGLTVPPSPCTLIPDNNQPPPSFFKKPYSYKEDIPERKKPKNQIPESSPLFLNGWRRDSITSMWKPTEFEVVSLVYNKEGYTFDLHFDGTQYLLPISVGGATLNVALSTTKRTLTLSSREIEDKKVEVDRDDFLCCMPEKKCQVYCGEVSLLQEESCGVIELVRFLYYVGEKCPKSRVGLIGGPNRLGLFSMLRQRTDTFCFDGVKQKLHIGSKAAPPGNARIVRLMNWSEGTKNYLALPCTGWTIQGKRFCTKSQSNDNKSTQKGRTKPVPMIVHLEVPSLSVPSSVYQYFIKVLNDSTNLYSLDVFEDKDEVEKMIGQLPTFTIHVKCEDGAEINLDISPKQYLALTGEKYSLMISSLEPREDNITCFAVGNCVFKDQKVTFSRDSQRAWFW